MPSFGPEKLTKVVQVSNVSPSASREQLYHMFGYFGRIEEMKVYPSETSPLFASAQSKLCYIKYDDRDSVDAAQHMTNTVFIDRALVCVPVMENKIPDEETAMKTGGPALGGQRQLPPNIINQIQIVGTQQLMVTIDPSLAALGLPPYPPLPSNTDAVKMEEIRRTVYVGNLPKDSKPAEIVDFFNEKLGEIMYLRMAGDESGPVRYAYVEFTNQHSIPTALQNNGIQFKSHKLRIQHSTVAIIKPLVKTQDMAKKEVEDALKKAEATTPTLGKGIADVDEVLRRFTASSPIVAAKTDSGSPNERLKSRSRSRGRSQRYHSRSRSKSRHESLRKSSSRRRSRSKSPAYRRRHRSKSRSYSKSRDSKRHRSKSKSRERRHESRRRSPRSKSRERKREEKERKSRREKELSERSEKEKRREKERSSSKRDDYYYSAKDRSGRSEKEEKSSSSSSRRKESDDNNEKQHATSTAAAASNNNNDQQHHHHHHDRRHKEKRSGRDDENNSKEKRSSTKKSVEEKSESKRSSDHSKHTSSSSTHDSSKKRRKEESESHESQNSSSTPRKCEGFEAKKIKTEECDNNNEAESAASLKQNEEKSATYGPTLGEDSSKIKQENNRDSSFVQATLNDLFTTAENYLIKKEIKQEDFYQEENSAAAKQDSAMIQNDQCSETVVKVKQMQIKDEPEDLNIEREQQSSPDEPGNDRSESKKSSASSKSIKREKNGSSKKRDKKKKKQKSSKKRRKTSRSSRSSSRSRSRCSNDNDKEDESSASSSSELSAEA